MRKKYNDKIITYLFQVLAVIILIGSVHIYNLFGETSSNIKNEELKSSIEYIENITTNISDFIISSTSNNIYKSLDKNSELREVLEKNLQLLITNRYKYIYVLDKEQQDDKDFRFLLDGTKDIDEKSEFGEDYTPENIVDWNSVYKTKKSLYFEHKNIKSLWLTYLKPIIINDKVEAIVVIDFSLKDHEVIVSSLKSLDYSFVFTLGFLIIIFIVIVVFSYIDKQRIKELKNKSQAIQDFNAKLAHKIKDEVAKNREKDKVMLHQSRLAQMGEMISMIAHQWRQPLNNLSILNQTLILKYKINKLDSEVIDYFKENSSKQIKNMSDTINDFRNFFKPEKQKVEFSINDIILNTIDIIKPIFDNNKIDIIFDKTEDINIIGFPNELGQALLNIINNAKDALIENNIENKKIKISIKKDNQNILLSIQDNAGGIPTDIIDKIFDPYYSTKEEKNGTGLGLYMTKIIIEEHLNGKLSVSNDKDGAVFSVGFIDNGE